MEPRISSSNVVLHAEQQHQELNTMEADIVEWRELHPLLPKQGVKLPRQFNDDDTVIQRLWAGVEQYDNIKTRRIVGTVVGVVLLLSGFLLVSDRIWVGLHKGSSSSNSGDFGVYGEIVSTPSPSPVTHRPSQMPGTNSRMPTLGVKAQYTLAPQMAKSSSRPNTPMPTGAPTTSKPMVNSKSMAPSWASTTARTITDKPTSAGTTKTGTGSTTTAATGTTTGAGTYPVSTKVPSTTTTTTTAGTTGGTTSTQTGVSAAGTGTTTSATTTATTNPTPGTGKASKPTPSPSLFDPIAPTKKPAPAVPGSDAVTKPGTPATSTTSTTTSTTTTTPPGATNVATGPAPRAPNPKPTFAPITLAPTAEGETDEPHHFVVGQTPSSAALAYPIGTAAAVMPTNADPTDLTPVSSAAGLSVLHVTNEYGPFNRATQLPYAFLFDSFLLEPYKETVLELTGIKTTGCTYAWTVSSHSDAMTGTEVIVTNGIVAPDGKIVLTLTDVGEYTLGVTDSCMSAAPLTQKFWVKYVRRELSSLTDADREAFLDAFHTLWTVSTTEGQKRYGERYKSVYYFAALHNDGGGNAACDEFHGDVGFLNNHMYLSAYLEQSMQLVDPRVCLHYMEYSKYFESQGFQTHLSDQLSGGGWTEMLTDKFFGRNDPITGRILDGRWGDSLVPQMTPAFMAEQGIPLDATFFPSDEHTWLKSSSYHIVSPYGYLRSPWNYNPSPYTARYDNVFRIEDANLMKEPQVTFKYHEGVQCADYEKFFAKVKGAPVSTYLTAVEDDTHGILHFTFGGVGGDKIYETVHELIDQYGFSYSNIAAVAVSAQPFFKIFLAQNPTVYESTGRMFPLVCSASPWNTTTSFLTSSAEPGTVGGPSCAFKDYYYESEAAMDELINLFFRTDPSPHDPVKTRMATLSMEDRVAVMKLIANSFPFDGDLAGSGAALDPIFWVAHGGVERLFQKSIFADIFSDLAYKRVNDFPCSGHEADATKAWLEGFYFADESVRAQQLTNAELLSILNPRTDEYRDLVSFVYDTNSFSWCEGSDAWFEP